MTHEINLFVQFSQNILFGNWKLFFCRRKEGTKTENTPSNASDEPSGIFQRIPCLHFGQENVPQLTSKQMSEEKWYLCVSNLANFFQSFGWVLKSKCEVEKYESKFAKWWRGGESLPKYQSNPNFEKQVLASLTNRQRTTEHMDERRTYSRLNI